MVELTVAHDTAGGSVQVTPDVYDRGPEFEVTAPPTSASPFQVFVLDDDATVLTSIELLLRSHGLTVQGVATPEALLARLPVDGPACLLLDLRLADRSGLDVQADLKARGVDLPIVFLSGRGDVPTTARAISEGALDFLVKPVDEADLLAALERAGATAAAWHARSRVARDAAERLDRLTARERQVCELVAGGLLNKQIAHHLGASENTVKVHRARVMRKLEVDSVPALVRLLADAAPPRD